MSVGSIIPEPRDEEDLIVPLYGRNEAQAVVLNGWASNVFKSFVGAKDKLAMKTLPEKDLADKFPRYTWEGDEWRFISDETQKPCMQVEDLWKRCNIVDTYKIREPLVVQVLAKKCVWIVQKDNEVLLIGTIVVGDGSGFCNLVLFNDAIAGLYEKVEPGNYIIICEGLVQKNKFDTIDRINLCEAKKKKMEIKIKVYQTKEVFLIVAQRGRGRATLVKELLPGRVTWLPAEIWQSRYMCRVEKTTLNVCGVVSYVGPIWRSTMKPPPRKAYDPYLNRKDLSFCFRWLQIVDATEMKPISVMVHMNNLTFNVQADLVPGVVVVIKNVFIAEKCRYHQYYLETTYFSEILVNADIATKYLPCLPECNREIVRKVVSPNNSKKIFQRNDVKWSAGGILCFPFRENHEYLEYIVKERSDEFSLLSFKPRDKFGRREHERVHVKGFISKVFKVRHNAKGGNVIKLFWVAKEELENVEQYIFKETKIPEQEGDKYWYSHVRELPKPILNTSETGNLDAKIFRPFWNNLDAYKQLCSPLLLPANYGSSGDCPKLKELPKAENFPYFVVYICDPAHQIVYKCLWKSKPCEEMEEQLNIYFSFNTNVENLTTDLTNQTRMYQQYPTHFILDLYQIENASPEDLLITLVDFAQDNV